jgi:hypothetical protein
MLGLLHGAAHVATVADLLAAAAGIIVVVPWWLAADSIVLGAAVLPGQIRRTKAQRRDSRQTRSSHNGRSEQTDSRRETASVRQVATYEFEPLRRQTAVTLNRSHRSSNFRALNFSVRSLRSPLRSKMAQANPLFIWRDTYRIPSQRKPAPWIARAQAWLTA